MRPIYTVENLSEFEKEWFEEESRQREISFENATNYLDEEALLQWLNQRINDCKECLHNAFRELEYKQSPLNELPLDLFVSVYGFIPISPSAYCVSYKWLPIYEKELAVRSSNKKEISTISPIKKEITEFEQYITYADSDRKAKAKAMLHDLIDGKQGKWVALVIRCCINNGLITKPHYSDLIAEFGNVIGKSNYKKYLSETTTPPGTVKKETSAIEKRLSELV